MRMAFYFRSMGGRFKFLLLYLFWWIIFFECARLLFLLYHFSETRQLPLSSVLLSFVYGLKMDVSVSSYFLLPVCIFVLAGWLVPFFRKALPYKIYSLILLFLVLLLTFADLEIYKSWGFRIDAIPLRYLATLKEAWASINHLPVFLILFIFLIVYAVLGFLFIQFINRKAALLNQPRNKLISALLLMLFAGSLIIPARGGLQQIPINQSSVYFSKYNFANVAAINATWNFINGVAQGSSTQNPYLYFDSKKAASVADSLYRSKGFVTPYLKTSKPNVILIVWESFTQKATHTLIDGKEITPHFNQLKKQGIYFSNVYASGDRTDKGLAAILSGYPAMNNASVLLYPQKSFKLKTLGGFFKEQQYQTRFYYGGETEFANIKSYILQNHFDAFTEKDDFSSKDQNSKWGAHDGVVEQRIINDLSSISQPFFITWLTLSSHEPYETPEKHVIKGSDRTSRFANSLHYTDEVVFDFIEHCKQQPWWNNTLVVIIADHGHPLIGNDNKLENFQIPMLWLGGALNHTGIIIDKYASQLDLPETLAQQIQRGHHYFPFSKNIFDSTAKAWAYFSFNNGFGWAEKDGRFAFDNIGKQIIIKEGNITDKKLESGKAMQQFTYQDFIDK